MTEGKYVSRFVIFPLTPENKPLNERSWDCTILDEGKKKKSFFEIVQRARF